MHQSKKGDRWFSDIRAHIGVDAKSRLAHTARGSANNVNDSLDGKALLHGQATEVFAYVGYRGADQRAALDRTKPVNRLIDEFKRLKASICAKVEHPFRVIKRQFGHVKVRCRVLKKNTAQRFALFALSKLWRVLKMLCNLQREIRAQPARAA